MRVVMSRGTAQTCWNFEKKTKKILRANANIVEFCLILRYFLWSESHEILEGLKNECLELKHVSRIIIFLDCVLMQKKKIVKSFSSILYFHIFWKGCISFQMKQKKMKVRLLKGTDNLAFILFQMKLNWFLFYFC